MAESSKPKRKYKTYKERRAEAIAKRNARWDNGVPDSVLQRKTAIGLAVGLMVYAVYVFIARICVPMIQLSITRKGSRTQGIVLLSFFLFLFLMNAWCYLRLLTKSPGLVVNFIDKTPSPPLETFEPDYEEALEEGEISNFNSLPVAPEKASGVAGEAATLTARACVGPLAVLFKGTRTSEQPIPRRMPPRIPVLQPFYRWCTKCERLKPFRTHHCRHCGTCILNMDHHCPWIGGCVGARNHKYFIHFLQWTSIWILFVFLATLLAIVPPFRPADTDPDYIDPQHIILLVIAAVFSLFTWGLHLSHVQFALFNMTTIEEIGVHRMKAKESAALAEAYGVLNFRKHRQVRREWEQEWGSPRREGNPWWLGSYRKNWEAIFGTNKLAWFLPIAASPHGDTGLDYQLGPRHTANGIWMKRKHWPAELQ